MVRAHDLIPRVLAEVIRKAPLTAEKVDFAWRSVVGPAMDRVTRVRLDPDGVLIVTTTDPHWAREVRRSSKIILPRLESLLGPEVVRRIASS